ncbi:MAG: prevent-host-death protein [bacterium]
MKQTITANDLKVRGVAAINEAASDGNEVFLSIRGKKKYVIIPIEKYNYLSECVLDTAIRDAKSDLKTGKFFKESIKKHIKRITPD